MKVDFHYEIKQKKDSGGNRKEKKNRAKFYQNKRELENTDKDKINWRERIRENQELEGGREEGILFEELII